MDFINRHRIVPGQSVQLAELETRSHAAFEGKKQAKQFTAEAIEEYGAFSTASLSRGAVRY